MHTIKGNDIFYSTVIGNFSNASLIVLCCFSYRYYVQTCTLVQTKKGSDVFFF